MLQKDIDRLKNGVSLSSADKYLPLAYEEKATILSYADSLLLVVCESAGVKEKANTAIKLQNEDIKYLLEDGELCRGLDEFTMTFPELTREYEKKDTVFLDDFARGSFDVPVRDLVTFTASTLPVWNGKLDILLDDLSPLVQKDSTVVVMGGTEKAAKTLLRISKTRIFRHFIFRSSLPNFRVAEFRFCPVRSRAASAIRTKNFMPLPMAETPLRQKKKKQERI